jgi:drug/metabolite transporter (DMT)-like permease
MPAWIWYAVGAALLYALHQIFTKLAAEHISDGLGGLIVETSAAVTIALYLAGDVGVGQLAAERDSGRGRVFGHHRRLRRSGHGALLPPVPSRRASLGRSRDPRRRRRADGAAAMTFFGEEPSAARLVSVGLAIAALYLLVRERAALTRA